jgi:PAS domain S-box-containing protein
VQTAIEKVKADLHFTYFPLFAKFLRENHLTDFVKELLRLSEQMQLRILVYFSSMSEEERINFSKATTRDFLSYIADNKAKEQIEDAKQRWMRDQLPLFSREQVIAEDILAISYVRKKAFLKFIPLFTTDLSQVLELVSEIDTYMLASETIYTDTYIELLNNRIDEHALGLEQNEQLYKQAQALAHVGNWSWDLDTNTLEWSDELYRIYGMDPAHKGVDYHKVSLLNHPDDTQKVLDAMEHSRNTHEPHDFYYRIILEDGSLKTLHARGDVIVNSEGRPYQMVGTLQDVTERQNLIERLMQNEQLYKQAQALSHIGNWTWLIKEGKILWTDELYRIYGLEPQSQEITFELYASFIHPDDKEELFNTIQNALSTKMPYDLHHRIIAADGSVKHLNAKGSVQLDKNDQPQKMLGTAQDVTERTIIEQAVRESQHFIQKTADATPAIITSYNINTGTYRFVSMGLKKLLGYDPNLPLQEGVQFFVNIVHPDDLPVIMEKNAAALALANSHPETEVGEPIVEFEYRMRHANGEYRWFHTFGTVFDRNNNAQVENVLNISIDTTERKEMETALTQKNLLLEQSNANLEEFAYVASHDLKEPLRKISIFGDRLLSTQYQYLGAEGQLYLEKIIDSSRKMQALINDLLSLSLISGNKSFVQHSLQDIMNDVLRTLEYKLEEIRAAVHVQPLPEAKVIPSQFRQLFQNLLSNSLKFVKQDVQPVIHVNYRWLHYKDVEQYKLIRAKQYLEITFTDNGIGFDNMFAGKIFAIFQRLNQKAYEGTGIGLAICKKIVENHSGVIFASGAPDDGATFTLIIPV